MAERIARDSQYRYDANANLVLQADRSQLPRREGEPTGEAESLWGKINPREFGSRAQRSAVEKEEGLLKEEVTIRKGKSATKAGYGVGLGGERNVLAATDDFEGLNYRPRTKETQQTYELLMAFVAEYLGEQSREILLGATDATLEILKNQELRDLDRKREMEALLASKLASEKFAQLVGLGKKIYDYDDQLQQVDASENVDTARVHLEEGDLGVAVAFDDEDDLEGRLAEAGELDEGGGEASDEEETEYSGRDHDVILDEEDEENGIRTDIPGQKKMGKLKTGGAVRIHPRDVDAHWLQRQIAARYADAQQSQIKTSEALRILSEERLDKREVENALVQLFEYDHFDLVVLLTQNQQVIMWCTRLARAGTSGPDRDEVIREMKQRGGAVEKILSQITGKGLRDEEHVDEKTIAMDYDQDMSMTAVESVTHIEPKAQIDLDELAFEQGSHLMSNKQVILPEGSFKRAKKGYDEIHVPPPKANPLGSHERLVTIAELPSWVAPAFPGTSTLNRVQSSVYPSAFQSDDNMLLCAPTGAGKTNVAMLCVLHELAKHRDSVTGVFELDAFKIVYIAPMKALVQEMVRNFREKLAVFNVRVEELTGDRQMTKQQIAQTQMIVTTPEKWDIITRKGADRSYTQLVRLVIIDEIHLLHDERGPVLESLVCRTLRTMEETQQRVRLVGLSATLPNYEDVALFLRVPKHAIHFFDNSYRPCPLQQLYIGITERKALKRYQVMNEVTYEKVAERAGEFQVLIFVHSRKETHKTARAIRDLALENDTIGKFLRRDSASREILQADGGTAQDEHLRELLPYGFAIHHAGMSRADRTLVEELFAGGHIQVLCSTSTLAWGVNLPAHTVIIKGTQVYSPEKGRWTELSPQDVLQMLGRSGRPQYDTVGEGIILTTQGELQYYLSLLNQQLPIESQFISRLADNLNAEIVLGTVRNREDAVQWLGYTYLYVRMLRNPALYGITTDERTSDKYLIQKRVDLIHAAALLLDKSQLIKYDRRTGRFQVTELGRIASHYYISHGSMASYNQYLRPLMSNIDLFRIFALSEEFKFVPVREEEKLELSKLLERVPVPVKEGVDEPTAKINVLLQAYISRLKLEGFALTADMVYVTQSASRILRAMFEICLRRGWAQVSRRVLDICKMVEKRQWLSMTPLRQFTSIPTDVVRRLERKEFPFERLFDLDVQGLSELLAAPKGGKALHRYIHQFPKLDVQALVQPLTRSLLRVALVITPDFEWDDKVHGSAESFWIWIEDVDGEVILFHDTFLLKKQYAGEEHRLSFTVPLYEPLPPNYFVSVISDRWLVSETRIPISFKNLVLPDKFQPHTELLDLQPLPISALKFPEFEGLYETWPEFNPIQTQTFSALYGSDENTFVGAPTGSGKTVCAELALMRLWMSQPNTRAVYVAPYQEVVDLRLMDWYPRFSRVLGGKSVAKLTGEVTADLKILEVSDVVLCTPRQWDVLSRRWRQRKGVQSVGLFIADEVHLVGGDEGHVYEVVISRMRFMSTQLDGKCRIVALGVPIGNSRDFAEWIGCGSHNVFNFHPMVRPVPLEVHIQSYNIPHFPSLMIAMAKPTFTAICTHANSRPVIVFVPSRKQSRLTAAELLSYASARGEPRKFLHEDGQNVETVVASMHDKILANMVSMGIAFYHESMSSADRAIVESLFISGVIQVVVASRETSWGMQMAAHMVVIMGSQYYHGKEHRYADYSVADMLQMMGRASRPTVDENGRVLLMCNTMKKDFYKKFLHEALPVESHLDHYLHDHFNAEIVAKTIENKQDAVDYLTWTYLYRRMTRNPNYYGLQGATQQHLSDHLSELVETTLNDLASSKCISIEDEMDVVPLNLGMITAYYDINYVTIETFDMSLTEKTRLKGLLEIIASAAEFDTIPIRNQEEPVLRQILDRLPVKPSGAKLSLPGTKTNILLQAHFSRFVLPPDLASDQKLVLERIVPLLQACVDVISSNGWLNPALSTMELCQMCVQAQWDRDSSLRQIPHFTANIIKACEDRGIESVFDFAEIDDKDRSVVLQELSANQVRDVARFVNRYPSIELDYEIISKEDAAVDCPTTIVVQLNREGSDEEDNVGSVVAPYFPLPKDEGWWLVVGEPETNHLLGIKRVALQRKLTVKFDFVPRRAGPRQKYKLYFMCDAYLGCDQEYDIEMDVAESNENVDDDDAMQA